MSPPVHPARLLGAALCAALLASGCGNEPSPEQVKADAALAAARSALASHDSRTAGERLRTALALDEALGRKPLMAEETRMLGDLAASGASFDSALFWYGRSLAGFRGLADRSGAREITLREAGLRRRMGQERTAFAMYVEALRLARVFHDDEGVREIEWAMLPGARTLDEREEESDIILDLLQAYAAAGDLPRQAEAMIASGDGRMAVRSWEKATEDYLRALMFAEQGKDSLLAIRASLRLGMSLEASGKPRDALTHYAECLRRADRTGGARDMRLEALIRVGNLYLRGRQFAEAARFFRAALASAHRTGNAVMEGYMLVQLGACDAESSRESALQSYRSGMDLLRSAGCTPGVAYASLCTGNLFLRNNQPTDALGYFKKAIEQSESVNAPRAEDDLYLSCEQAYVGARATPWYDEAIDILLQLGRYEEAFWYVDRRANRELFGVLSSLEAQPRGGALRTLLESWRDARARAVGAERQCLALAEAGGADGALVEAARAERESAAAAMNEAAGAVVHADRAMEPFVRVSSAALSEIQKALPPGTALVEHVLTRRSLYAFVVTGARSGVYVAAYEKDRVFDLAKEYAELLRMRGAYADSSRPQQIPIETRLREVGGPLAEAFLLPIEGAIAGVENLYVVRPAEVASLPLHALSRGSRSGYLAEAHTVSYLPSASCLRAGRARPVPVKDVVALGCAGGTAWDVEYELRDIRAFYKQVRLYFDQQASLGTLQHEHEDLLHLAVRYRFNDQRPGNSFVVLADSESPGTLKNIPLGELLSLPGPGAVVVSDLDGGRLGIRPSEPYLFLAGGTQDVVFTSSVPSRKAKKFFGEVFYTALLGGADVRAAYRKVQLEMIRTAEYAAPFTWAPFELWGR